MKAHASGPWPGRLATLAALACLAGCGSGGVAERTTACLAPAATGDRDVARHAGPLADPSLCIRRVSVAGTTGSWTLTVIGSGRDGPLWLVPHDDEDAGFDGAVDGLLAYGGTLVAVETGEERLAGRRDPNRAFGAGACAVGKGRGDPAYTRAVLGHRGRPVIAVHSNARRTVSMRRPYRGARPFPAGAATAPLPPGVGPVKRDDATMVILAGPRAVEADPAAAARVRWFTDRGVNVLYETVTAAGDDCSLSNHAVLTGAGATYTIEVRDGDGPTARALVALVAAHAGPEHIPHGSKRSERRDQAHAFESGAMSDRPDDAVRSEGAPVR